MSSSIEIRLLGPLEVGGVQFEGAKQRRLFVALALRAPEPVSVDELVQALWGDEAPDGREQALQKQVSRLRARLGDRLPVRRRAAGYVLEIEREAIDSRRFEALLACAEREQRFEEALALWRGPALADHRFDEFAQSEIARLEELRLEAIEERLAAELARGQAVDLVGELRALVAENPLRERLRGSLMLALYRAGRQADALEVMREGRRLLVDELGLEPGPGAAPAGGDDPGPRSRAGRRGFHRRARRAAADGRERDDRPRGRAGRDRRTAAAPRSSAADTRGHRRRGQDEAGARGGRSLAGRFAGGAAYVDLAGVEDAGVLMPAAASALGVVAATPGRARRAARARDARRERAARARRLRALPRRSRAGAAAAGRRAEPDRAGDQPRAAAADHRARLPRAAAGDSERRGAVQGARGRGATGLGAVGATTGSSPRSARASTGCRWRSSSRPTARGCCRCRRCWSASSAGSNC